LGYYYANGVGVTRNFVTAYYWDYIASAHGGANANIVLENLTSIVPFMTPSEIDEAKELAHQFKPQKSP
jgi:TPR repeat protein